MSVITLCYSAPWTATSYRFCGALIKAGATISAAARPASLYDLMCNLDDEAALRTARAATTDPVSFAHLNDELTDLRAEHTEIRHALIGRFRGIEHHHI
ncbi:hypothetical protein [Streptomyces erythrochromogenes]|uniref:hypothetical protein n=1 Tax=Streptomyces erythrochromogenes TaxID=285574 RepID=UPI00369EBD0B